MKIPAACQIVLLTMVFGSCSLVVDVDVPIQEPRLTVNSLFTPDSVWSVALNNSRNILDKETFFMPRTVSEVVILDESENIISTLHQNGFGVYRSAEKPEEGKTYYIRISSPNQNSVTARGAIPKPVSILSIKTDTIITEKDFGPHQVVVTEIRLKDPANETNYYRFNLYTKLVHEYIRYDTQETVRDTTTFILGLGEDSPELLEGTLPQSIISDTKFNGKEVTIRLMPFLPYYGYTVVEAAIVIHSLSEEYFKYMTTLELQHNTDGDPFAQPVKVFNNINNGFGIFAGYSSSYYSIK
jgi:hypothetical protein